MTLRPHANRVTRRTALSFGIGFSAFVSLGPGARAHSGKADGIVRTIADYDIPTVTLTDAAGKPVRLDLLLAEPKPAIVEFFFTSCTTICGLQASAVSNAQAALAAVGDCTIVSISIDPEFDTPARLSDYAKSFDARPNWLLLTGRQTDVVRVLTAFNARNASDNKMLHQPYTFIRTAPGLQWLRLQGLFESDELVTEFKEALAHPTPPAGTAGGAPRAVWRRLTN